MKSLITDLEKNRKFEVFAFSNQSEPMAADGVNDISEIYAPPRVTAMSQRMGLKAGWANLVEVDPDDDQPWDVSRPDKRAKAVKNYARGQAVYVDHQSYVWFLLGLAKSLQLSKTRSRASK